MKIKKPIIFTLITVILISIENVANANLIKSNRDIEIYKKMIGSWVVSPQDEGYQANRGAISTYHEDGSMVYQEYTDAACTEHNFTMKGYWFIKDTKLVIVASRESFIKSDSSDVLSVDIVKKINENKATLVDLDGYNQYRVKSNKCISKK